MNSTISSDALAADAHAAALLQQVTDDRERRCASLAAAAAAEARQIVRSALTDARHNVSHAVTQERTRMELGMRQASARADIEARRRERQKSRELLEQMWAAITGVLEQRWRQPAARRAWVDAALAQTAALLSGRAWLIESGSDWSEQQRDAVILQARQHGATSVEWSPPSALLTGLKVRAGQVCVDASVTGLLAQRDAIEAAFLAEYLPEEEHPHG